MRNTRAVLPLLLSAVCVVMVDSTSSRADPVTFSSELALRVFTVSDPVDALGYEERDCLAGEPDLVGTTPSSTPLEIPGSVVWFVAPVDRRIGARAAVAVAREAAAKDVPGLSFEGCSGVGDQVVGVLAAKHKSLQFLDLRGTSVSERSLALLAGHPNLTWLDVADRQPADLSWARRLPSLRAADVSGAWISAGALEGFGQAKRLESLTIRRCSAFGEGALYSLRSCKSLKHLFAGENPELRDAALIRLAALPGLSHLELARTGVTDEGLGALAGCRKLESVDLSYCAVDGSGLSSLAGAKKLRRIVLRTTGFRDAAAPALAGLKQIRSVSLADTAVSDAGIAALARHSALEELDLEDCSGVTADSLATLGTMTSLRRLVIRGTAIPRTAVRDLARSLPRCHVE